MIKVGKILKPLAAHHVDARHNIFVVPVLGIGFREGKFIQFLRVQYPTHQHEEATARGSCRKFLVKIRYCLFTGDEECERQKSNIENKFP